MLVYCNKITNRLQYIVSFIAGQISAEPWELTDDKNKFINAPGPKINYSEERSAKDEFFLRPVSLLFESNIAPQKIDIFSWNDHPAFFKTDGDLSFDIFSACFYLITRYEEYLPHKKDMYGRYAHENSLAFKEGFLKLPLVDIWLQDFTEKIKSKFSSFYSSHREFNFVPTYDIDEMFCYLHKPRWKNIAGNIRSVLRKDGWEIKERKAVLKGSLQDPYDSFDWLKTFHTEHHYLQGFVFILVAEKNGQYDKNISPASKAFKEKITWLFDNSAKLGSEWKPDLNAGLHPSWQSGDNPALIKKELDILQYKIGLESHGSRQHYIRFTLPQTYRNLIAAGIWDDHSMGYGSINGFRASVSSAFYWYDLGEDKKTDLKIHPFCFMDANSFYEQKNTPQEALEEMMEFFKVIQSVNGTMITIWHNTFLGSHRKFAGWREVYEEFVRDIYFKISYVNYQVDNEGMDKRHFPG